MAEQVRVAGPPTPYFCGIGGGAFIDGPDGWTETFSEEQCGVLVRLGVLRRTEERWGVGDQTKPVFAAIHENEEWRQRRHAS